MPWIRLDEHIAHHPKFVAAGPIASWLWVCGMSYCARYLTDGAIPASAINSLGNVTKAALHADTLVKVGLWEVSPSGWMVHDYHGYQPSKQQVEHQRSIKKAAGKQGGIRSGSKRQAELKQRAS